MGTVCQCTGRRAGEPLCNRGERGEWGSSAFNFIRGRGQRPQRDSRACPGLGCRGPTDPLQLGGVHLGAGGVLKSLQRLSRAPRRALLLISHWPLWPLGPVTRPGPSLCLLGAWPARQAVRLSRSARGWRRNQLFPVSLGAGPPLLGPARCVWSEDPRDS